MTMKTLIERGITAQATTRKKRANATFDDEKVHFLVTFAAQKEAGRDGDRVGEAEREYEKGEKGRRTIGPWRNWMIDAFWYFHSTGKGSKHRNHRGRDINGDGVRVRGSTIKKEGGERIET